MLFPKAPGIMMDWLPVSTYQTTNSFEDADYGLVFVNLMHMRAEDNMQFAWTQVLSTQELVQAV